MSHDYSVCKEYVPCEVVQESRRGTGIKHKNLAEHAEICQLEEVCCPFYDAGCETLILREALDVHLESSTQQHLMKVMTAYS